MLKTIRYHLRKLHNTIATAFPYWRKGPRILENVNEAPPPNRLGLFVHNFVRHLCCYKSCMAHADGTETDGPVESAICQYDRNFVSCDCNLPCDQKTCTSLTGYEQELYRASCILWLFKLFVQKFLFSFPSLLPPRSSSHCQIFDLTPTFAKLDQGKCHRWKQSFEAFSRVWYCIFN